MQPEAGFFDRGTWPAMDCTNTARDAEDCSSPSRDDDVENQSQCHDRHAEYSSLMPATPLLLNAGSSIRRTSRWDLVQLNSLIGNKLITASIRARRCFRKIRSSRCPWSLVVSTTCWFLKSDDQLTLIQWYHLARDWNKDQKWRSEIEVWGRTT
jgi:hypothetical protein